MIRVEANRVMEDGMDHSAQAILALAISGALCLAAWIWARHRLTRSQARADYRGPI
jgi:hypothetical protein